jgi:hypothetical protein
MDHAALVARPRREIRDALDKVSAGIGNHQPDAFETAADKFCARWCGFLMKWA